MRKVKWSLIIDPEIITEYAGVTFKDYFTDPRVMLKAQLKARDVFEKLYGVGHLVPIGAGYGSYVEATALGVELIFHDDITSWPKGPVLKDFRDVDKLRVLDPYTEGFFPRVIYTYRYMKGEVGDRFHIGIGGTEGPITTSVIVRGNDFFIDVYRHPEEAHELLDLVTEASLRIRRTIEEVTGETIKSTGIADDYAGALPPIKFSEFVCPYYRRIYEAYGREGRRLHSELLKVQHLNFLSKLGITSFDPGTHPYLSIRDLKRLGVPFVWCISALEMLYDSPDTIKMKFRRAVDEGAPTIMGDLCSRGIPKENIKAFVEVAREYRIDVR